jgi:hypothetical protein
MAILQALIAFITRSFGKILSALFDWAVIAIFGYTSGTQKVFLSVLLAAAGAWPLLLLGIVAPRFGTFVLSFVPIPASVPKWTVRAVWIALSLLIPLAVGAAMAMRQPDGRLQRSWPARLLRGFPITIGLSIALFLSMVTVPVLRAVSAARRRKDVQVPLITDRDSYREVAERILTLQRDHGHPVRRVPPPWWLTAPLRVLRAADREAFRSRIPSDFAYFEGSDLVLALYPSGLLIRGRPDVLAVAQGLIVVGVSEMKVWQTSDPRAQAIEKRIAEAWPAAGADGWDPTRAGRLREITGAIAVLPVEYDDWQIVYRKAVQLGRALHGQPQLLDGLVRRTLSTAPSGNGGGPPPGSAAAPPPVMDSPAWIAVAVGATMAFGAGALVSYVSGNPRRGWTAIPGRRWLQSTLRRIR